MSLPVKIPTSQFHEWDKQISRFIWKGKKPRVKYSTLTISKEKGGMSLPNLRDYYYSPQLKTVILWCDNYYEAKWKDMERKCKDIPTQALIGDYKLMITLREHLHPLISFTLHTWFDVLKQLDLLNQLKKFRWVEHDTDFKPNGLDSRFKYWTHKGINAYCNIPKKNTLQSFQTLKDKYGLEKYDFFRYLQLRQYLSKEILKNEISPEINKIIQLTTCAHAGTSKSIVSTLYRGIAEGRGLNTTYIKERWEKELKENITNQQWDNICMSAFATSSSMYWREFCWKNLVRFFVTPKMKTYLGPSAHTCWRNCGNDVANHHHVFWSCPNIQAFWEDIQRTIQHILGLQISPTCTTLYLGNLPEEITQSDKYLLRILTTAAKKAITRKWFQADPPTLSNWLEIVEEIHMWEKLTFLLRLRRDLYITRWSKWSLFY